MRRLFLFISFLFSSVFVKAAVITITIDDSVYQRTLDGFALQNNYQPFIFTPPTMEPVPNPEPKDKFMNRIIAQFIQGNVASAEARHASTLAVDAVVNDVKSKLGAAIEIQSAAQVQVK